MILFPAQQFDFEREMAQPVLNWLQQNRLEVKSEFSTPWGICDMVGVQFDRAVFGCVFRVVRGAR